MFRLTEVARCGKSREPLSNPIETTRVFEILPNQPDTHLCLCLREIKLSEDVQYDRISYTWGEDLSTVPIRLNGQPYEIRRNLWAFIDVLRCEATASPWLWGGRDFC